MTFRTLNESFVSSKLLAHSPLLSESASQRIPLSFDLEITARCNNDCRHCYINLLAGDQVARSAELSVDEIAHLAGEAVSLGALWCLITGGEPLLRSDFEDLYLALKRVGLLVSVFTNACLITNRHVELFAKYPPRRIEVTVYGVTQSTYESVTRRPGSFAAFQRGLGLLQDSRMPVTLKAMALRSNVGEWPAIVSFCRERSRESFRFDPMLHLRYDGDSIRNDEIRSERLFPEEIAALEQGDEGRMATVREAMAPDGKTSIRAPESNHLFRCGAGNKSFSVTFDGYLRLCATLREPHTMFNLRTGTLSEGWHRFIPAVRDLHVGNDEFLRRCGTCPLANVCLSCPAHAYLECGEMDARVPYFCEVAHARAASVGKYDVTAAEHHRPPPECYGRHTD